MAASRAKSCIKNGSASIEFSFDEVYPLRSRITIVPFFAMQTCAVTKIVFQGTFRAVWGIVFNNPGAAYFRTVIHIYTHAAMVHQGGNSLVWTAHIAGHGRPIVCCSSKVSRKCAVCLVIVRMHTCALCRMVPVFHHLRHGRGYTTRNRAPRTLCVIIGRLIPACAQQRIDCAFRNGVAIV